MEDVKVRFPDGRITWMPRKTATSMYVVQMGGHIVEQVVKVPKTFAPIVVEEAPEEVIEEAEDVEGEQTLDVYEKPKKKRKTRSDKGTKHGS